MELCSTTNILVRVFNVECRLFKVVFFFFAQHNVNSDFLSFLVVIYFYSVYVLEMINVSRTAYYELLNVQLIILGLSGEITYYSHEKGEFLP